MRGAAWGAMVLLLGCSSSSPYDLSKVEGLSKVQLNAEARALLENNGFVVLAASQGDISAYYSGYSFLPKFITVDVGIELFLVELESSWVRLEAVQARRLQEIHAKLWDAALARERQLPESCRVAFRRLLGLIAVGRLLLDPAGTLPESPSIRAIVETEVARAKQAEGETRSELWNRSIRWTAFKPAGPYAATEELQRLYRYLRWWGFAGLQGDDREELLCAGILAWLVETTPGLAKLMKDVESTYDSLLGPPEGVTLFDLMEAKDPAVEWPRDLGSPRGDEWLRRRFSSRPAMLLDSEGDRVSVPGKRPLALRLHPPRRTPEAVAFSQVRTPNNRLSRGLDVLAVRGSRRARALTLEHEPELKQAVDHARREQPGPFQKRLWDLCDTLAELPADPAFPRFMRTDAYRDRGLSSALATWAGSREIHAVHVQDVFERKGILKFVPPLIDPHLEAWQRLVDLCRTARDLFKSLGLEGFAESTAFAEKFKTLAERQRRGEILEEMDDHVYDFKLGDYLSNALRGESRKDWPFPVIDRRVCVSFATVTDGSGVRAETTRWAGKACCPILVVTEHDGELQLYLGGVLDYREFDLPAGQMLTRAEFRALMDSRQAPPAPSWTSSYRAR